MKLQKIKTRNWVAKNNRYLPMTHRDRTEYQRHSKHKGRDAQGIEYTHKQQAG